MTLIKDLIEIPEAVQRGDFVLRLAEGVTHADATLRQYVVTPELAGCFDNALSFIRSALQDRTSKSSFLDGSFGSGKSHFMAVLHLILQGNTAARSIPELAPVIAKHSEWIGGKKFLLVPYHLIGATNMEAGILGGYVEYIQRHHPEAPIPGVYLGESLFQDAAVLRQAMGDTAFFGKLNEKEQQGQEVGWGDFAQGWTPERYDAAVRMAPQRPREVGEKTPAEAEQKPIYGREQLVGTLIQTFFGSYNTVRTGGSSASEGFVSLDQGMAILSRHAQQLGYDGLILFLDELILWLASHASDLKFVHREVQKLAKLVEAQSADRPIPVISFVARQRNLRDLIGDSVPGADRLNFADSMKHWEGRFHQIKLEDRNLPAIAQKRVLRCKSEAARAELDRSFEQTRSIREATMNILLTREGDRAMFHKVYPFSPALVQTLIAVSSMLQRERTALKVMMQLLVDHRETLAVGDIMPVGDLFDVVAHGDEAFSPELAGHFNNARRLYQQKLLPLLEAEHGRVDDLQQLPTDHPRRLAFRNDDRLIKTLLLAALVPQVEALKSLNAERLAALNHGTIRTPIQGKEGQEALRRVRKWAASVGEIHVGDETNPTIAIRLSGVDTDSILKQALVQDSHGNRVRHIRQIIFEQVGISGDGQFEHAFEFDWKKTKRSSIVLFRNIRELTDASIENASDDWKLIIDFPFDEQGHGPRDDLSRLQKYRDAHPTGTKTICWVPAFFSKPALDELGTLVLLDYILTGERFTQYANHLSLQDRQAAKQILESQRNVLQQRVRSHVNAAYGLDPELAGSLDTTHGLEANERFVSLWHGLAPQAPVAVNLKGAMESLLGQALSYEYPGAPEFEAEPRGANLSKVYQVVSAAARSHDTEGRVPVEKGPLRLLVRGIAEPLKLGAMPLEATHFVMDRHWKLHFDRKASETGSALTVQHLRKWIDEPRPMGLPREVQNLVILAFAQQTNRSFYLHNVRYEGTLADLPEACELKLDALPDAADWTVATDRAGAIFGVASSSLLNATNAAALAGQVKRVAAEHRVACAEYQQALYRRLEVLGLTGESSERYRTATATRNLADQCHKAAESDVVAVLARAEVATSPTAMGESLKKAVSLKAVLASTSWEIFEAVDRLTDDRQPEATRIRSRVIEALQREEHAMPLGPALQTAQSEAVALLTRVSVRDPEPKPEPKPREESELVVEPTGTGPARVRQRQEVFQSAADARQKLEALERQSGQVRSVKVTISWDEVEEAPR